MTSANISTSHNKGRFRNAVVKIALVKRCLYNKRRIVRSVDDSVAKVVANSPQLIRRSRGYVPYPVFLKNRKKDLQIFAAGSDLKAAFCLYKTETR